MVSDKQGQCKYCSKIIFENDFIWGSGGFWCHDCKKETKWELANGRNIERE